MAQPSTHQGSCLCGGVRFEIAGPLAPIQICYCSQCRKAQGGPLGSNIPVKVDQLTWLTGRGLLREYESTPGKLRAFCTNCGSPVYSARPTKPDVLRIRAGLLDEPVATSVELHQHLASRCSWWPEPQDELPHFTGPKHD